MKYLKYVFVLIIGFIVITSFSQCSSTKTLQKNSPLNFGEVYCQAWTAGTQQAGSGIDIYIPANVINENSVELDSVYFRDKVVKLEREAFNKTLTYIGRFRSKPAKDIIISSDPKEEYGNSIEIEEKIPFELKDNECVISYNDNGETKYFKIENILEKPRNNYPTMRSN